MADMVTSVSSLSSHTHLRSASDGMFDVPRTRIRQGSQAFSVAGPRAWNTLPLLLNCYLVVLLSRGTLRLSFLFSRMTCNFVCIIFLIFNVSLCSQPVIQL